MKNAWNEIAKPACASVPIKPAKKTSTTLYSVVNSIPIPAGIASCIRWPARLPVERFRVLGITSPFQQKILEDE